CHLAGFVHDQIIQLGRKGRPSEQPGGSRDNVDVAIVQRHLDGRGATSALNLLRGAPVSLIGLLDCPDRLASSPRHLHELVEQVADDLMAVRRYPDSVAALDQLKDDLGSNGCLAGSGRTLDGQVRAIEMRCKQHGHVSGPFARLNERRSFDHALDARRLQAKEIAHRAKLPSATEAVIYDVLAKPEKGVSLIVSWD